MGFLSMGALAQEPPLSMGHYVGENYHKSKVVIFVHGLFGNASASWACKDTASWPEMLLSDEAFADSDIYAAGYETPLHGGKMTLDEVVSALKNRLDADSVLSGHQQIIFVAHSLGGLVVQRLLLLYPDTVPKTKLIYFFSTPETGSEVAKYAKIFNSDPLISELRAGNNNDYLESLEDSWRTAQGTSPIKTLCAYETKKTHHVLVVDRQSATRMCPVGTPLPISKDHVSIVKPCSSTDASYVALRNAVKDLPLDEPADSTAQASSLPETHSPTTVYAPRGIAIGGNNYGNPTVNNNFRPPLPQIQWHSDPIKPDPRPADNQIGGWHGDYRPGASVSIHLEGPFQNPAFLVKCSAPCVFVGQWHVEGQSVVSRSTDASARTDENHTTVIVTESTNQMYPGDSISFEFRSTHGWALTITDVQPYAPPQ